jgi:hypothetical protein
MSMMGGLLPMSFCAEAGDAAGSVRDASARSAAACDRRLALRSRRGVVVVGMVTFSW